MDRPPTHLLLIWNELCRDARQLSKILIEKQIVEELKRKMQENFDCYNDTIKDNEENMDGKEEHFQIMQKKLLCLKHAQYVIQNLK